MTGTRIAANCARPPPAPRHPTRKTLSHTPSLQLADSSRNSKFALPMCQRSMGSNESTKREVFDKTSQADSPSLKPTWNKGSRLTCRFLASIHLGEPPTCLGALIDLALIQHSWARTEFLPCAISWALEWESAWKSSHFSCSVLVWCTGVCRCSAPMCLAKRPK